MRSFRAALVSTLLVMAAAPVTAQADAESVRAVLRTSAIEDAFDGVGTQIRQIVMERVLSADSAALDSILATHFHADSLFASASRHFVSAGSTGPFAALRAWLLADSIRTIESRADSAVAARPLDEYARGLAANPPAAEVIEQARRFAAAQRAGEFYVRYVMAVQGAAFRIGNIVAGEDLPVPNPTAEQRAEAEAHFANVALVSFLQRFEALSEPEILRLLTAYETPSGAWYVATYIDAIEHAIAEAAARATAALDAARNPG